MTAASLSPSPLSNHQASLPNHQVNNAQQLTNAQQTGTSSPTMAAAGRKNKVLLASGAMLLLAAVVCVAVAVPVTAARRQTPAQPPTPAIQVSQLPGSNVPSSNSNVSRRARSGTDAAATAAAAVGSNIITAMQETSASAARSCNGVAGLCSVPIRLVTFPGTHNSNAIKNDLFIAENQKLGFKQQLEAGARLFDLDYVGSEQGSRFAHCFSCFCSFASDPAEADPASVFKVMGEFLAANPRELIVIGLSNIECGDKSAARQSLLATLAASSLYGHLATQVVGPSTTLGQLVDSKQRVVLLFYDAWTSPAGWPVGTKTVPSQPLLRFYGEDISIDARNAAAIDLQVGSRLTQGISNQFLAEQRSPDTTWRVLGLFPSTCVVCRTGAQCGSAACAVKANSQPYVMYLLGSLSSRWLVSLGAKQQQFIPAFNGFQVDQIQVPAATGGKGIVSAAERLNKALGWLYLMKPSMASKVGLGNCVWVLDDSIYSGALICVHHGKAAIAQLLEVAAGGGGAGRRLVIPGNSRLQVQMFAGNQLQKQYTGKDAAIQLLDVAAAVDSVQVLWP